MASRLIVPFDNRPVSTQAGSGSYTVPAGKYALVTINTSGSAYVSSATHTTAGSTSSSAVAISNDSFNNSLNIWLKPGDVLSNVLINASATASTTAGNANMVSIASQTTSTISVNSVQIAQFRANTSGAIRDPDATATASITISGVSSYNFFAQEYNVLS